MDESASGEPIRNQRFEIGLRGIGTGLRFRLRHRQTGKFLFRSGKSSLAKARNPIRRWTTSSLSSTCQTRTYEISRSFEDCALPPGWSRTLAHIGIFFARSYPFSRSVGKGGSAFCESIFCVPLEDPGLPFAITHRRHWRIGRRP
jgi:hypothetical protein